MKAYECVKCGARFTTDHVTEWGRHANSDGLGTRPVCSALIESRNAPPAANGEKPREVCRGDLALVEVAAKDAATVAPTRPIK